jgi:DNA-binding beta-propeller fold protein YncE
MDTAGLLLEDVLSGPGQIVVDNERSRILVADTRHHRIVITDFEGRVTHIIGTAKEGWVDSVCEESQFRHPQGIAADADFIYVADAGNHIIRRVDRRAHQVTTIAGSGKPGCDDGAARDASFEEPVSLALANALLYIADARSHMIRVLDLQALTVSTLSLKPAPAGR